MATTKKNRGNNGRTTRKTITRKPTQTAPVRSTRGSTLEAKPMTNHQTITAQAIAEAAYFLWLRRGGNEVVNWLEAEAMLQSQPTRL